MPEQQELCWDGDDDDDHSGQAENLARVSEKLNGAVLDFCRIVTERDDQSFHIEDLRMFVVEQNLGAIAPDSPGRILRLLKQKKRIDYIVTNRRQSTYLLLHVT
jgi:hypothetical protein